MVEEAWEFLECRVRKTLAIATLVNAQDSGPLGFRLVQGGASLFQVGSQPSCCFAHSCTRRALSSSDRSSTRVMIDQRIPNGSRMLANRSPDTNVIKGSRTVAPAASARATTSSTSLQYRPRE